jgi:peptidoglycan/LPS O-acetylase OafA/YrhL
VTVKTVPPAHASAHMDRTAPRTVRKFRPDIQGLRAFAVTLVVLSHLGMGFPGGYVGVDVFFVISGFLITQQLMAEMNRTNNISLRGFYARRIRRILPAAAVVIIGTLLACRIWDSPLRVKPDALDAFCASISGMNWRLAEGGANYFQASALPSSFQHFWSLSVEEQFYMVWPSLLLLVGVGFGRKHGRRKSLLWLLLVIMSVSLILSIRTTSSSPSWAYFGTQTRVWELAFGALLAVTVDIWTKMPPALASQMSWFGLGMIMLSAFIYNGSTEYPGAAVVLPVMGAAWVIAGGCPGWPRSAELILRQPPAQLVGKTSYSWYLVHWPILTILPLALGHSLTAVDKWLVLFGSLALAIMMFYAIEQPVRRYSLLVRKPSFGLALGGILVAASVGTTMLVSDHVAIPGGAGAGHAVTTASDLKVVEEAINAAAGLTKLPQNVTPSLEDAPNDQPFTTAQCLMSDTATVPAPNSRCTFGDLGSTRTIAVVGDSHANEWTPAIITFAKANHWKIVLYMKAGCPPGVYPDDVDPETNRLYTQCNEWRGRVFARLKALRPNIVLVSSELRTLDLDPTGMVEAIREYQEDGARVIYVEDTPNPEAIGSVPDCLAEHANDVQACSLSRRAEPTRLDGFVQRRIEASAVRQAGAALIDPTPWFCTSVTCPPIINNLVVYMDSSHVTATYIQWLTPLMSSALNRAIDRHSLWK